MMPFEGLAVYCQCRTSIDEGVCSAHTSCELKDMPCSSDPSKVGRTNQKRTAIYANWQIRQSKRGGKNNIPVHQLLTKNRRQNITPVRGSENSGWREAGRKTSGGAGWWVGR